MMTNGARERRKLRNANFPTRNPTWTYSQKCTTCRKCSIIYIIRHPSYSKLTSVQKRPLTAARNKMSSSARAARLRVHAPALATRTAGRALIIWCVLCVVAECCL